MTRVRFQERGRTAKGAMRLLAALRGCRRFDPLVLDQALPLERGGAQWGWVQHIVLETGRTLADTIQREGPLLGDLCPGLDPRRVRSHLQKEIQRGIYDMVGLVLTATEENKGLDATNVVIVKSPQLARIAAETVAAPEGVIVRDYASLQTTRPGKILAFLASWLHMVILPRIRQAPARGDHPARVALSTGVGVNRMFGGMGDLWWLGPTGPEPERVVLLFEREDKPATDSVLEELRSRGFSARILRRGANQTTRTPTTGFPPPPLRTALRDLGRALRATLSSKRRTANAWQLVDGLSILNRVRSWEALYRQENIRVVLHFEEGGGDAMSLAADLSGTIRVGFHWSDLRYPDGGILFLHQVYCTWGPQHVRVAVEGFESCIEAAIQVGCIFTTKTDLGLVRDEAEAHRSRFQAKGIRRVVASYDASLGTGGMYPPRVHEEFYRKLLSWVEGDPSLGLIVKCKHPEEPRVLQYAPDLRPRMERLKEDGRLLVLDGRHSVAEASLAADLAVALGYNSAGTVAALTGTPTVYWTSYHLERGPLKEWILRNGWADPDRVFSQMDDLVRRAAGFLANPASDAAFGDHDSLLDEIDPFRDGAADERMGWFVKTFLKEVEGKDRDEALASAVSAYGARYGVERTWMAGHGNGNAQSVKSPNERRAVVGGVSA